MRKLRFNETTIKSTSDPTNSCKLASTNENRLSLAMAEDLPPRNMSASSSLGKLSIHSEDLTLSDAAKLRQIELEKARNSLSQYNSRQNFSGLSSRYFQKSPASQSSSNFEQYVHSESTISESDLLPTNCSTPRTSLFGEQVRRADTHSLGQRLSIIANSLKSGKSCMEVLTDIEQSLNFESTPMEGAAAFPVCDSMMSLEEMSFQSGAAAIAKLDNDQNAFPKQKVSFKDFSVCQRDSTASIGSFFKQRSDDLPNFFARSPQKKHNPVPLIEAPDSPLQTTTNNLKQSLQISDIQQILSSDASVANVVNNLLTAPPKKRKTLEKNAKENISPPEPQKSILSTRSSSALTTLPKGKLPIESTKTEIIWGCIKVGKSNSQELVLRNRSAHRLGIQCTLTNPSFRINKDSLEMNFSSTLKIILHAYESRVITLTFSPTTMGAAVDTLDFTSTDHKQAVKQQIKLYGYGGSGHVVVSKMVKDVLGKYLLALGNLDETHSFMKSFVVKNPGSLPAFAFIYFVADKHHLISRIDINPSRVVLLPGEEREVLVTYHLHKKDLQFIKNTVKSSVIEVGKLQLMHGTEADRGRLRNVCKKAKEKNKPIEAFVTDLISKFPGEVIISDLKYFRESVSFLADILKLLHTEEVTVTLEQDIDTTSNLNIQDETEMYQSLYEMTVVEADSTFCKNSCLVEPTRLILTPPDKIRDRIFFTNNDKKQIEFEVSSSPQGLVLKPYNGVVQPGETAVIELYLKEFNDKTVFKVKIFSNYDCFDVDVKVILCR